MSTGSATSRSISLMVQDATESVSDCLIVQQRNRNLTYGYDDAHKRLIVPRRVEMLVYSRWCHVRERKRNLELIE